MTEAPHFEWYADGYFGGVRRSHRDLDGTYVFKTFAQARKALVREMRSTAADYRAAAREFERFTLDDVEEAKEGYLW